MKRSTQFDPLGNRYQFDEGPCRPGTGWAQVDTKQDASYYGIWTNPKTRQILTFCEGDITVETAENDEEYIEAVRDCTPGTTNASSGKGSMRCATNTSSVNSGGSASKGSCTEPPRAFQNSHSRETSDRLTESRPAFPKVQAHRALTPFPSPAHPTMDSRTA